MKDMIKKVREDREGFTLAELLIVVAIIAVLVAIAIPVFNSQLEKSREAVDLANIRAAYAECASSVLTNDSKDGYSKQVEIKQTVDGWVSSPDKIAGTLDVTTDPVGSALGTSNKTVYVEVSKNGTLSLATSKTASYEEITN